jgi:hypothetical protein
LDEIAKDLLPANEFSKVEWFDVGRRCNPNLTWTEFEVMWAEFWEMQKRRNLN